MSFSDETVRAVGPLTGEVAADVWPKIDDYLTAALERDGFKLRTSDLLEQFASGLMGLYVVHDFANGEIIGALATEVQDYPNARVFNLAYCGGKELHRWAGLLGAMEKEAARLGCQIVRITGRKGWGRIFPDYPEAHRVFEREVTR